MTSQQLSCDLTHTSVPEAQEKAPSLDHILLHMLAQQHQDCIGTRYVPPPNVPPEGTIGDRPANLSDFLVRQNMVILLFGNKFRGYKAG